MKFIATILIPVMLFSLSACAQPQTPPSKITEEIKDTNTQPMVKTSMGDFVIVSARFADEVHGEKPAAGEKILLMILTQPGLGHLNPGTFSLEAFQNMTHDTSKGEIYILGDDGSRTISTMGGWVDEDFTMGFRMPASVKTYTLFWQDSPPIDIVVSE